MYGQYLKQELHNLSRFISVMRFRALEWRSAHPYLLVDRYSAEPVSNWLLVQCQMFVVLRMEDLTSPELTRQHPCCDRTISLYGYMRGAHLQLSSHVHIPGESGWISLSPWSFTGACPRTGCGDFPISDSSVLPDPCPLPEAEKKRSLVQKERLVYAPMAGLGGIVYDKVRGPLS